MHARIVKWGVAVGLSAAMVVGTAGVGAASVPEKSAKKFCNQLDKLGDNITTAPSDAESISSENAAELQKNYKKLAKAAPTKSVKQALNTISSYYGELADGADAGDLAEGATDFAQAYVTFSGYVLSKCIAASLPDITLPDNLPNITLPDIG